MGEIHISLVKDDNFLGLYARADFVCPEVVMLPAVSTRAKHRRKV